MYKILKVLEEPKPNENGHISGYATYALEIQYEDGTIGKNYLNKFAYNLLRLKIKLMEKGVGEKLIQEFEDAVREEANWDHDMDKED
jgi:hypothetical protein